MPLRYNLSPFLARKYNFLARKGPRGMVERVFQHPANEKKSLQELLGPGQHFVCAQAPATQPSCQASAPSAP